MPHCHSLGGSLVRSRPARPTRMAATVRRAALSLLLVCASACVDTGANGSEGEVRAPGDAARAWAVSVDRDRQTLARREWKGRLGDGDVTLSGFSAGDTLRMVREVVTQGESGRQAARYYFDGVQLRYYEAEGARRDSASGAVRKFRLVLAFDERGAVAETSHLVDGVTAAVDSAGIQAVLARAAEVARQWATTPATRPAAENR